MRRFNRFTIKVTLAATLLGGITVVTPRAANAAV
jgi:hypothetical protein